MTTFNVMLSDSENNKLTKLKKRLGKSGRTIMRDGLEMVDEREHQRSKGLVCVWVRANTAQKCLDLD